MVQEYLYFTSRRGGDHLAYNIVDDSIVIIRYFYVCPKRFYV